MFSFYVDPKRVDPSNVFDADMTRYLDWFQRAEAIPGKAIMTPGEPERAERARRAANGVPMPSEVWTSIVAAARSVGVNRDLSF
jgi:hydroxycarboxylate dehydrogenase B